MQELAGKLRQGGPETGRQTAARNNRTHVADVIGYLDESQEGRLLLAQTARHPLSQKFVGSYDRLARRMVTRLRELGFAQPMGNVRGVFITPSFPVWGVNVGGGEGRSGDLYFNPQMAQGFVDLFPDEVAAVFPDFDPHRVAAGRAAQNTAHEVLHNVVSSHDQGGPIDRAHTATMQEAEQLLGAELREMRQELYDVFLEASRDATWKELVNGAIEQFGNALRQGGAGHHDRGTVPARGLSRVALSPSHRGALEEARRGGAGHQEGVEPVGGFAPPGPGHSAGVRRSDPTSWNIVEGAPDGTENILKEWGRQDWAEKNVEYWRGQKPGAQIEVRPAEPVSPQVPIEVARRLPSPVQIPDDPASLNAIRNTPGVTITPDGIKVVLSRFQKQ